MIPTISRRRRRSTASRGYSLPRSGLIGWWDARLSPCFAALDGTGTALSASGVVGYATDLSGSGNHLVSNANGNRPDWDANLLDFGLPAFAKVASTTRLFSTGVATAVSATSFSVLVCYLADGEAPGGGIGVLWAMAKAADFDKIQHRIISDNTTAGRPIYRMFTASSDNTQTSSDSGAGYGGAVPQVALLTYDRSGNSYVLWQNGHQVSITNNQPNVAAGFDFTHFAMGCSFDGTTQLPATSGHAAIFGMASWNRVLSAAEGKAAMGYYAAKLAIPYNPSVTPRKTVFLGDSHVNRPWANQDFRHWPTLIQRHLPPAYAARMCVRAVSGTRVSGGSAPDLAEQWDDIKSIMTTNDLVFVLSGGNDMINENHAGTGLPPANDTEAEEMAETAVNEFAIIFTSIVTTTGCKLLGVTVSPAASGSVSAARRHGLYWYNELLDSDIFTGQAPAAVLANSHDTLAQFTAPGDATHPVLQATYNNGDDVHLTASGIAVQLAAVVAALPSLQLP